MVRLNILSNPGVVSAPSARPSTRGRVSIGQVNTSSTPVELFTPSGTGLFRPQGSQQAVMIAPPRNIQTQNTAVTFYPEVDIFKLTDKAAQGYVQNIPDQDIVFLNKEGSISSPKGATASFELPLGKSPKDASPQVSLLRVRFQAKLWAAKADELGSKTMRPDLVLEQLESSWEQIKSTVDQWLEPLNQNPNDSAQQLKAEARLEYFLSTVSQGSSFDEAIRKTDSVFTRFEKSAPVLIESAPAGPGSSLFKPRADNSTKKAVTINPEELKKQEILRRQEHINELWKRINEIDRQIEELGRSENTPPATAQRIEELRIERQKLEETIEIEERVNNTIREQNTPTREASSDNIPPVTTNYEIIDIAIKEIEILQKNIADLTRKKEDSKGDQDALDQIDKQIKLIITSIDALNYIIEQEKGKINDIMNPDNKKEKE